MRRLLRSPATRLAWLAILVAAALWVGRRVLESRRPAIDLHSEGLAIAQLLDARARWDGHGLCPGDVADPLWRYYLAPEVARLFFTTEREGERYDPWCYLTHDPNLSLQRPWPEHPKGLWKLVTNSLGMRRRKEVLAVPPDLRVLCTGDSHTDGVCWNGETWPMQVEKDLARQHPDLEIECLNAGKGGYTFRNYLGLFEKYVSLHPQAFVVCVYGGNDFCDELGLWHYFDHSVRPPGGADYPRALERGKRLSGPALAQSFLSYKYFQHQPGEVEVALEAARSVSAEIVARCREEGVLPVFVYLPALPEVRWQDEAELCTEMLGVLGLEREDLAVHDRLADGLLSGLRALDVDVVDLRPDFRSAAERLYWHKDQHLDVAGHRLVADLVAPLLEARLLHSGD